MLGLPALQVQPPLSEWTELERRAVGTITRADSKARSKTCPLTVTMTIYWGTALERILPRPPATAMILMDCCDGVLPVGPRAAGPQDGAASPWACEAGSTCDVFLGPTTVAARERGPQ
mmetsp:Transcript_30508/g.87577  ORF Transcript_30508/g.87577 Transcript_30508/m.87577 type:complete len:118 (-) Transcript_30508:57-410(-)